MSEPYWVPLGPGAGVDYEGAYSAAVAYVPGDVVVANGVPYMCVNPGTGQTPPVYQTVSALPVLGMGTALPASPYDGQEYTLVDSLTAPTYSWTFRYVAAKSTNKWVFVGGSPVAKFVLTGEGTSSASTVDLATDGPSFTAPVAGLYLCQFMAHVSVANAATSILWLAVGGGNQVAAQVTPSGAGYHAMLGSAWSGSIAAGVVAKLRYQSQGTIVATFSDRTLIVTPIAVGG